MDPLADVLPAAYPIALIVGLIAIPGNSVVLRLGLVAAALPGLLQVGGITRIERAWFAVLGFYLGAICISAFAATEPSLAFDDLGRQLFLVAIVSGVSLALARPRARTLFAAASLAAAIAATALILSVYGTFSSVPLLGPVQETFKLYAATRFDLPVNAVSFGAVIAFALAVPVLARRPPLLLVLAAPLALAVLASGSRTSEFSLLIAIPVGVALVLLQRQRLVPLWVPLAAVAVVAIWALLSVASQLAGLIGSPALTELTTGRNTLWIAGARMFADRPWFGWGGGSFAAELARYLPGIQTYSAEDLRILGTTGGAHNAYLTALAERGVVGGIGVIVLSLFLVWLSIRLFAARHQLRGVDLVTARLAPFVVLLILLRGFGELPGWFGYADSLVDFLAYGVAAMMVAVAASVERGSASSAVAVAGRAEAVPVPTAAPADGATAAGA